VTESNCNQRGRCCNGADCSTGKRKCTCENCDGGSYRGDNDCTPGACWTYANGEDAMCEQKNPCECEYLGGEFGGPGSACPGADPPPPPPEPPEPPPNPGPVIVYCCDFPSGSCISAEYFCPPGYTPIGYTSCQSCKQPRPPSPPPPPPPPGDGCDNPDQCFSGVCCDGNCCPGGLTCCGTTCCAGFCCDGVCQDEPCGACESNADCGPGRYCCDGVCQDEPCGERTCADPPWNNPCGFPETGCVEPVCKSEIEDCLDCMATSPNPVSECCESNFFP
jgi:hypothetical protein